MNTSTASSAPIRRFAPALLIATAAFLCGGLAEAGRAELLEEMHEPHYGSAARAAARAAMVTANSPQGRQNRSGSTLRAHARNEWRTPATLSPSVRRSRARGTR